MKLRKLKLFDLNVHLTVDGTFKDYRRNIPATVSNYLSSVPDFVDICGALEVGIPQVGGYSHDDFNKIYGFRGTAKFAAVTQDTIQNPVQEIQMLKNLGYLGLKYHPRSFQDTSFSQVSKSLIRQCSSVNIIYGICTYESDQPYSQRYNYELRKTLDYAVEANSKIILFHGGGKNFGEFYSIYGKHKNVFFDCSFSLLRFKNSDFMDKLICILNTEGENVGFGTDYPDYCVADYQEKIKNIFNSVSMANFEKFISTNSMMFLGANNAKQ